MNDSALEGIAIIGVHGRFPGADSAEAFWANLVAGKESISRFSDEQLTAAGWNPTALRAAGEYIPARGVLEGAETFDAAFFGIQPREAEVMDPQHRVFLEACWESLERSGYAAGRGAGSVGVYAGASNNTFYLHALHPRPELRELVGPEQVMLGNEKDYLATRVAYKIGLRGPAISVNTACSSSLVAVCLAQQALLTFQCDLAIAGGVSIIVPQHAGYYFQEGSIGSPDGHTRTFDAHAQGVVPGNGVSLVVLKRLEDAVADGDEIYAVIKGAAMNNDGSQRAGFGAPGVEGQSEAIALAQSIAGFDPESIAYVEAHGTATPIGDPIEIAALTKAFRRGTQRKQFCAIGSVKTNIGHLDAAAGTAGLIKTALALRHRCIPPSLHFTAPNPKLDLPNSPFFVNASLRDWTTPPGMPRRAGISSFGIGGTNCHLVLEEPPPQQPATQGRSDQIVVLSGKNADALEAARCNLAAHLRASPHQPIADVAYTLQVGRCEFPHRRIVVCDSSAEAAELLEQPDSPRSFAGRSPSSEPPVIFLFPGQGSQFVGMGAEIYRTEPIFRDIIDQGARILEPLLGLDLRTVLFASPEDPSAEERLRQTRFTQPALFLVEYALARLWMAWGVRSTAMLGHSVGEYVAACLAGVFPMDTALRLVAQRAELVQAQAPGTMLAVRLPEDELLPLLSETLSIAAVNAPRLCVASGPLDAIADLEQKLTSRKIAFKRLATSHAFHSAMMDPVVAPFTALLRQTPLSAPTLPYLSNVTARWITPEEATQPDYWAGHVRQTVRFSEALGALLDDPNAVILEVGPSQALSQLARQHPARKPEQTIIPSMAAVPSGESVHLRSALGRAWIAGVHVDWPALHHGERRRRLLLPTYPFARQRFWPQGPVTLPSLPANAAPSSLPGGTPTTQLTSPDPAHHGRSPDTAAIPSTQGESLPQRSRSAFLVDRILEALTEISGTSHAPSAASASFMELGLDSLLLTQAATRFQRKFGVPISFRQLMEDLSSAERLALYLDSHLAPGQFEPTPPQSASQLQTPPAIAPTSSTAGAAANGLAQLVEQQIALSQHILLQLRNGHTSTTAAPPAAPLIKPAAVPPPQSGAHGPFRPAERSASGSLTETQQRSLAAYIERYTRKTAGSKALAAQNRGVLADPRSAAGFKDLWKEMVYPIHSERSDGARIWDVDGHEYIDFVMGFGASLFGHRPPFVVEAIQRQVERGFEIGPIQPIVGDTARLVSELTGMERVAFCNTGSEAVLAAIRVSRTVTGRDTIAVFSGAYHGVFDEVLVRPLTVNGEVRSAPIAPGIPSSGTSQVRVFDWANPDSLELIRQHGHEIAAVLVEPVQSRRLDVQPRDFLQSLRRLTEEIGAALIFDEVVTGFRFHPGGAQAWYGIRADIATYGKVVGGGLPIGLVAGKPRFLDALDGGPWQFGDTSFPEVGVTFFAGTFVRHPITMAVAHAVLEHIKREGPSLQERVANLALRAATGLRNVIAQYQAPYKVAQASSILYLTVAPEFRLGGLLFYLLRERGIHIWENRAVVFTTAHTPEHVDQLIGAVDESLAELLRDGFLPSVDGLVPPASGRHPEPAATLPPQARRLSPSPSPLQRPQSEPVIVSSSGAPDSPQEFPLTDAQREVWLAALLDDRASQSYNLTFRVHLQGPLRIDVLERCVQAWVDRHDSLRMTFDTHHPVQRILPSWKVAIPLEDLSGRPPEERQAELNRLGRTQGITTFPLDQAPLHRFQLVRLGPESHVFVFTLSHLVADGWSLGVLLHEWRLLDAAYADGHTPNLPRALQFSEYRSLVDSPRVQASAARSEAFWKARFTTLPPALDLPADRMVPARRTYGSGRVTIRWEPEFVQSLRKASARHGSTLLVFLLAGFKTLLRRISGQEDIVVGVPAAGQISPSLEDPPGARALVGHCVNLLPVRSRCRADASFAEFVKELRSTMLDAFENQDLTFGRLIECLRVPRDPNRVPLAPIMFNLDRAPAAFQLRGIDTRIEEQPRASVVFDISINAVDDDRQLIFDCDFNTDLFEPATLQRWMGHYRTLVQAAADQPSTPLGLLPLLNPSEESRLVHEWNNTQVEYPRHQTIHGLIREQVRQTPDAIAVECDNEQLTYAELDSRSDALAAELATHGVTLETRVGLYLDRTHDLPVAALGVLKAGGAYLPLDPAFPRERLAFMADDAELTVIVTQKHLVHELPPHRATVVCVDAPGSTISPTTAPKHRPATAENLAYVMYTSGSTGKPKGVEVLHRGVVNFLNSMRRVPGMTGKDVVLAVTTLSFDISGLELYLPLVCGAKVVIASRDVASDGERLAAEMKRRKVTFMQATPTTWRLLLAAGWPGDPAIKILCGGEAFPPELARQLIPRCASLWNVYGPTETTIWSTCTQVREVNGPISIGRPIDNTHIHIVDSGGQPTPIGVAGELLIGGDGVARGYHRRPDLTQERFVPHPRNPRNGERLYRTGDLARWLPDGNIAFLGRLDHQVKLRGYRIELGEIESVISRQSEVGRCVVVVREDTPGDARLVAYLEPRNGKPVDPQSLRRSLHELPDYMVPQHFVVLEALPVTPNGKIDRRALPAPDLANPASPQGASSTTNPGDVPNTPTERALAELWKKTLKVPVVGRSVSFFDLGGHSLLASRLFADIEKAFGRKLPLATILRAETVAALATELDTHRGIPPGCRSLVAVRAEGHLPPFFCVHGAGGEVLFARSLARHLDPNRPFFGLQARALNDFEHRSQTVQEMAAHYLEEITLVQPSGPYFLGGFCMGGLVAYEMAQILRARGHDVRVVVMIDTYNPAAAAEIARNISAVTLWKEKIAFHWGNFWGLPAQVRGTYLRQRLHGMLLYRMKRLSGRIRHLARSQNDGNPPAEHTQWMLEEINDAIGTAYRPAPYSGHVLILKAQKGFSFLSDPQMGWGSLVHGALEIVPLPVNPGGMLVEPFIGMVGECISNVIQRI